MGFLFTKCRGKRTVLLNPDEILTGIATGKNNQPIPAYEITRKQLEVHMKNLVLDGYIDFSHTDDKSGTTLYVTALTTRGESYQRERADQIRRRWRSLGWKVLLAAVTGAVTSLFWLLR